MIFKGNVNVLLKGRVLYFGWCFAGRLRTGFLRFQWLFFREGCDAWWFFSGRLSTDFLDFSGVFSGVRRRGWFFAGRLRTDAKVESRLTDSSVLLLERPHESRSGCCPQKSCIYMFCSNFYTFFKLLHNVLLTLLHTVLFKLLHTVRKVNTLLCSLAWTPPAFPTETLASEKNDIAHR